MRRTWAAMTAAAVVAGSLAIAAPARAAAEDCSDYLNSGSTIEFESFDVNWDMLQVRINPQGVDPDVQMLVHEVTRAVDFVLCLEGGLATGTVNCVVAKVLEIAGSLDPASLNFRYVYQDPATGEIVIEGGLLADDAQSCLTLLG